MSRDERVCSVEGCGRPHNCRGFCRGHYKRWQEGAPLETPFREKKAGRTCGYEGCERPYYGNGWCNMHYQRLRMGRPLDGPVQERVKDRGCRIEGCERKHEGRGLCATHLRRLKQGRDLEGPAHERDDGATRRTASGYVDEKREGSWRRQHRLRIEDQIGRPLADAETVHHRNGVRDDNRLSNLELWTTSHPYGQRVEDKVEWAIELLRLYRPDALA